MKFCCECGAPVTLCKPSGQALERYVCDRCHRVYHHSPRLVAGCIATWEKKILLCRRAVNPASGLWGLPAGFVEKEERASDGAVREMLEEADVGVVIERPYAMFHLPRNNQVMVVFLARLLDGHLGSGAETSEARLFDETEIPWGELAFATTRDTLKRYFEDRRSGDYGFHFAEIVPFNRALGAAF